MKPKYTYFALVKGATTLLIAVIHSLEYCAFLWFNSSVTFSTTVWANLRALRLTGTKRPWPRSKVSLRSSFYRCQSQKLSTSWSYWSLGWERSRKPCPCSAVHNRSRGSRNTVGDARKCWSDTNNQLRSPWKLTARPSGWHEAALEVSLLLGPQRHPPRTPSQRRTDSPVPRRVFHLKSNCLLWYRVIFNRKGN